MNDRLTGNYRFRNGLFGKLILQVEYSSYALGSTPFDGDVEIKKWRDAKITDYHNIKFK